MTQTIVYVNATGEISGAERSLLTMLDAVADTRWQPVVAAPDGPLLREAAARGVQVMPVALAPLRRPHSLAEGWTTLRAAQAGWQAIARVVTALRPAVLHANSTSAMLYALRTTRVPVVWQVRDLAPLGPLGAQLYQQAAQVVAISTAVQDDVRRYARDGGAKIRVIPPAVDTTRFRPAGDRAAVRRQLGLPVEEPLIGLIAQFVPWKQHHLFLDALEQITYYPWHAVLAGAEFPAEAAYLASLRERIARPPLAGRVTWLPWQAQAAPLLAALDICALTSREEPFGRVLIEAAACGVACVAIEAGGPKDIIIPNLTGLLTGPEADAVAQGIATLLEHAGQRNTLGCKALIRAEDLYGLSSHRQALERLYDEFG